MNLINHENQGALAADEKALRELKDLMRPQDRRLDMLAVQTGQKEAPIYFARFEEESTLVMN